MNKRVQVPVSKILFLFIIFFTCSSLMALDPQKAIRQYKLDVWKGERGFDQNAVNSILQTRDGYIWMGTLDGLVRFDGIRFTVFNKTNTKGLNCSEVRTLYEDQEGNTLWIGSDGGISRLKDGEFITYGAWEKQYGDKVYSITMDTNRTLWAGTSRSGVLCMKNGKTISYSTRNGFPSDYVYTVCGDTNGNLWFGTSIGLVKRTPGGEFVIYDRKRGLECGYVYAIYERTGGDLWIGTDSGLFQMKHNRFTRYGKKEGLPDVQVMYLSEDQHLNLWGGTDGGGLFRLRNGKIDVLGHDDGLECGFIYSIYEDREGSLWLGTMEGGVMRLRDTIITTYLSNEGGGHDYICCIHEDRRGILRVGTKHGMKRLNKESGTLEPDTAPMPSNTVVHDILEDNDGNLWLGTNGGLHYLKDGNVFTFTTRDGLPHNRVNALLEDSQGNIWVGADQGLSCFHKGKFTPFTVTDKEKHALNENIWALYEDRAGDIWVGTESGTLCGIKEGKIIDCTNEEGLQNNPIECIFQDKEGVLYIGTRMGLSRLENGDFTHYTPHSGLIDSYVNSIVEDDHGNLWLGGRKGISCLGKKELKDFASGKISKLQPITYNEEDGMENQWCNSGAIKRRNGKLWFPTTSGAVEIDPANIVGDRQPPSVIIEELKVDGEQIPQATIRMLSRNKKSLVIPPGKKRLEFKYTGLSFLKPRKVKFKLKLQGYDPDWIDMGDARDTIYTGLSPGKYTLKVIARNRDGAWNETGDSLSFYMQPYIYETLWFYIFIGLIITMIAFFGYRFRVRQLKAREKLLADLVARRTKKLNERTLQLEKAHDSLRESKQLIEEKNRNILDSIEYARRIQQAILPPDQQIQTALNDYFIIFKPKDIVSGDFYWFSQRNNCYFIAVVDCTGHGVPGAFLSMIGNMKLNDIIYEEFIEDPAEVLSNLDLGVSRLLQQENGTKKRGDGMEVGLCMIDLNKNKIVFAGAKRPLYYVQDSQFFEIKGDRGSIGGRRKVKEYTYTNHEIDINDEMVIYLSSDGLVDQHNPGDRKYGSRRLKRFLHSHAHLGMAEQKEALLKELSNHQGDENQRDDITLIGIKLKKTT